MVFQLSMVYCLGCHGNSSVLSLVQGLLGLCQKPLECARDVRCEVARCLGEVGPVDFRCIALSTENQHSEQTPSNQCVCVT